MPPLLGAEAPTAAGGEGGAPTLEATGGELDEATPLDEAAPLDETAPEVEQRFAGANPPEAKGAQTVFPDSVPPADDPMEYDPMEGDEAEAPGGVGIPPELQATKAAKNVAMTQSRASARFIPLTIVNTVGHFIFEKQCRPVKNCISK